MNSLSTQRIGLAFVRGIFGSAGLAILATGLAGCAALQPKPAEQVVKERAQARWDALLKGDTKAAYAYMSPGSRSIITAEAYDASIRKGFWKSAVVEKVECSSPQSCEALATIEYEYLKQRTKTPLREAWIKEGSEWWYLRK